MWYCLQLYVKFATTSDTQVAYLPHSLEDTEMYLTIDEFIAYIDEERTKMGALVLG